MKLGLVACVFTLSLAACGPSGSERSFGGALAARLQAERPAAIDLATVAGFDWDELFVFEPGSQRDPNCALLKLDLLECVTTFPSTVRDDEHILVFRRQGRKTRVERHRRALGDFVVPAGGAARPQPILRTAANFRVVGSATGSPPASRLEFNP